MTKQEAVKRARELKARGWMNRTHEEQQELSEIRREHYYALKDDGHWR